MHYVTLNRGFETVVSDRDAELVARYRWFADVRVCKIDGAEKAYAYATPLIAGKKKKIYMHRLITGAPRGLLVDHRNGDRLDNRRRNLLVTTGTLNMHNRSGWAVSGYRGVDAHGGRYRARVQFRGTQETLGRFDTAEEAARAYDRAVFDLYGEFAWFNFPDEWEHAQTPDDEGTSWMQPVPF